MAKLYIVETNQDINMYIFDAVESTNNEQYLLMYVLIV